MITIISSENYNKSVSSSLVIFDNSVAIIILEIKDSHLIIAKKNTHDNFYTKPISPFTTSKQNEQSSRKQR